MASRGASWVGDIYQRFEALCQEVEETLNEDAVKFVEKQVQSVGTNVKKFYSDVMQDLVSQDSTDCTNVLSSQTTVTDTSIKSNALGDSKTSQLASELVASSDSGSISTCDKDVIGSIDSTDQKTKRANEDDIEVDETCVFVNENNISFVSYKDAKPQSYKKKIKEAFLSKKKSIRQEYKKLIKRYEDVNASSSLTCVDTAVARTLPPVSNTAELQTCEFQESDWEVL